MNGLQLGFSYAPNPCKNTAGYTGCVWDEYGRNFWEVSGSWQGTYNNVSFEFSGGYGQGEGYYYYDDPSEWTVGANVGFGGFTLGGSYKNTNARRGRSFSSWGGYNDSLYANPISTHGRGHDYDETDWDVGITYESGPWGFNLAYGHMEGDDSALSYSPDSIYYYEADAESWIGGVTYKYGPGMQIGAGVQMLDVDQRRRQVYYDDLPGDPTGYVQNDWESFDGWSFFIENTITF
jgi:predicted porin